MAAERVPSGGGRDLLSADLIGERTFDVVRRGFERDEVRDFLRQVASSVRGLHQRLEEVDQARRDAEQRALHPDINEDVLMERVGEETASILRSARAAAADMRTRAADEAAEVVDEAQQRAGQIRGEAEGAMARSVEEANRAAEEIRTGAQATADQLVERARKDIESLRHMAEQERRLTVEGAQSVREKILADLSRRRRVATVQIDQLRAGRERLLESYGVVRRTLEEVHDELQRADAEARGAADQVGRDWEHAELPDLPPDLLTGPTPLPDPLDGTLVAEPDRVGDGNEVVVAGSQDEVTETEPVADPVAEADAVAEADPVAEAEAEPEPEIETMPDSDIVGVTDPAQQEDGPHDAVVESLFDRIRAGRRDAVVHARDVLSGADHESDEAEKVRVPTPASAAGDEPGDGQTRSGDDEALLERREAALGEIELILTRKLKRALQDEQNDLLDRLRNSRGEPEAVALLGSAASHRQRYVDAALPQLELAARAGSRFAISVITEAGRVAVAPKRPAKVEELADELAALLSDQIRRRVEQALEADHSDDQSALIEALGAAYRETKTQRVERTAGDQVTAAFSKGIWETAGDRVVLRWVVEDIEGPCSDCDDNALAGALSRHEGFPTGQAHPPAHTGCRCLVVPDVR